MTIVVSGCFPILKVQQLNSNVGQWNRLYADIKFTCHGFITRWHYFAHTTGSRFLDVFRPNNDGSFTLISKTNVTASIPGVQSQPLAPEDWIKVEPGFIIGCHAYDQGSDDKVLTEENREYTLSAYTADQLSDVWLTPKLYDGGLKIGSTHTPTMYNENYAIPAINVDISTSTYEQFYFSISQVLLWTFLILKSMQHVCQYLWIIGLVSITLII